MLRVALVTVLSLASMMVSALAAPPAPLTCDGSIIEPSGFTPVPKSVSFVIGPPTSIDTGNGLQRTSVVSNNRLQLKFKTRDFTGEYFHYTGDLFLIYKSGHLARLSCQH